ncbi:unnamed protein product [Pleuronectes platessa]|uniref:Uncharacterized protein n=1 Tax=Pleuronectes platessa TaxID=8262 RepID=A0A9N7UNY7_PLEPL|nr:unnamed protein product [Pleuronectes platessa]
MKTFKPSSHRGAQRIFCVPELSERKGSSSLLPMKRIQLVHLSVPLETPGGLVPPPQESVRGVGVSSGQRYMTLKAALPSRLPVITPDEMSEQFKDELFPSREIHHTMMNLGLFSSSCSRVTPHCENVMEQKSFHSNAATDAFTEEEEEKRVDEFEMFFRVKTLTPDIVTFSLAHTSLPRSPSTSLHLPPPPSTSLHPMGRSH